MWGWHGGKALPAWCSLPLSRNGFMKIRIVIQAKCFPFINTCISLYAVFQIVLGSSYVKVMQLRSFYKQSHILPMPLFWFCNCPVNSSHVTWQWLHAGSVMHAWCACMRCNDCVCCFGLRNTACHIRSPADGDHKLPTMYVQQRPTQCTTWDSTTQALRANQRIAITCTTYIYIYTYVYIYT